MSRRNRNKKKKQKIQKKIEAYKTPEDQKVETKEAGATEEASSGPEVKTQSESIIDVEARKLISQDVKMIILTLLILGVILTTVRILQTRTSIINDFGDWLVRVLNIYST